MQNGFSEDQMQFRAVVARFLQDKAGAPAARRLMDDPKGYDPEVWRQLCGELGLAGTHIPEEYGGFGFGAVELGIAAEEMGRHLYCGPFFASSVMAGYALMNGATVAAKERLLPEIASGASIHTLVLDSVSSPDQVGSSVAATADDRLHGLAPIVVDAQVAERLVVVARAHEGLGLYLVDAAADGVTVTCRQSLDATRKLSKVEFADARAERIGRLNEEGLNRLWDQICVALAHESIGAARQLFESTVDYTKVRVQFGRPIGSFQALKHRCADLLMELEFARAVVHHAGFCIAANAGEPYVASMAKAMASDVCMQAAREAVQMRGGIGFTWEENTHLWFKRAKSSEVFMGSPHLHRERMMKHIEREEVAS
jgi:alkylation response protein AidB-like acyl-CoA dehydrogenase